MQMTEGMSFNAAFPGHQMAMPPPLSKDAFVEYQPESGYKGSLEQNAHDVTAFLAWAADPNLNARKRARLAGAAVSVHHHGPALSRQEADLVAREALTPARHRCWREPVDEEGRRGQIRSGHRRRQRFLQPAGHREPPLGEGFEPVGRALRRDPVRRGRRPAVPLPAAPRARPSHLADAHQLPRQHRRPEARRRHRPRLHLGLRLAEGPVRAGPLRARRPVHRPHLRAREELFRRRHRGARVDGASGQPAAGRCRREGGQGRGHRPHQGRHLPRHGGPAVLHAR